MRVATSSSTRRLGAAAAWPLTARAQQPAMPVIGFLNTQAAAHNSNRVAAFRQGLNDAGFVEGHNVRIEFRWADNQLDRLPALTADLVRRRVSIIVANGTAALAAKAATTIIPIVFVSGDDPVDQRLVTTLSRPGGNITGVSFITSPLNPKRLELLHELVPKSAVIAILLDATVNPDAVLREIEAAARMLGRDTLILKPESEVEINAAFASIVRQPRAHALFVGTGPFLTSLRRQIAALAARHALPGSYGSREFVELGGLMSYGASPTDAYRRGGTYVSRILKGEKPGDLPVELPTKYELVINLATAKALGLDIPPKLIALADEVIE
jgi:putative tryptophan/tyrosine transport system substrate-binding protein